MTCVSDSPEPPCPQCKLSVSALCRESQCPLSGFQAQRGSFKRKVTTSFPLFPPPLPAEGLGHPPSGCAWGPSTSRSHLPHSAHPLPKPARPLDELEALGLVVGQAGLEEHRVHPELRVQQGHVAVHLDKEVDAFVPLVKVGIIVGQGLGASWASKSPP